MFNLIFLCILIIGGGVILVDIFELLFVPHSEMRRRQRIANSKRGITMRRDWVYINPDRSKHVSETGREEDCICGGQIKYHPFLADKDGAINRMKTEKIPLRKNRMTKSLLGADGNPQRRRRRNEVNSIYR